MAGSVTVRRSIVMDADDQRMQLSLALQSDDLEVNTNSSVKVTLWKRTKPATAVFHWY